MINVVMYFVIGAALGLYYQSYERNHKDREYYPRIDYFIGYLLVWPILMTLRFYPLFFEFWDRFVTPRNPDPDKKD